MTSFFLEVVYNAYTVYIFKSLLDGKIYKQEHQRRRHHPE